MLTPCTRSEYNAERQRRRCRFWRRWSKELSFSDRRFDFIVDVLIAGFAALFLAYIIALIYHGGLR